jgi:hypothetical protein
VSERYWHVPFLGPLRPVRKIHAVSFHSWRTT